jgi:hypothetical protein
VRKLELRGHSSLPSRVGVRQLDKCRDRDGRGYCVVVRSFGLEPLCLGSLGATARGHARLQFTAVSAIWMTAVTASGWEMRRPPEPADSILTSAMLEYRYPTGRGGEMATELIIDPARQACRTARAPRRPPPRWSRQHLAPARAQLRYDPIQYPALTRPTPRRKTGIVALHLTPGQMPPGAIRREHPRRSDSR